MNFLLILLLGAAVIWLWKRVNRLEQSISMLEFRAAKEDRIEAQERPREAAAVSRPSVPLTRSEEPAEAVRQEAEAPPAEPTPAWEPERTSQAVPDLAPEVEQVVEEPSQRFQFDFEDVFGRRLPIWAGGITLAIAGVFLVRYSIESGLLTPVVRVALAFLFGFLLLGGAEWAWRNEEKVADPRVRQSLAGAGLATLYAAFYLAGTQYGLVGQTVAFLGLAAVTAGAIALSFRFGLPCAVLGLVGGFAAPALVGG
ncbi:MAG TPA: DUF2339 domain-containing protein, partial [Erythrobacter sp.]|nr:DUF2339 domain-containing protein [Erythrobacter sp.]